ncbi:MAG: 3-deoxy-D-manno-octulosonic acid transferase [Gammaproteobacteria bacterium]
MNLIRFGYTMALGCATPAILVHLARRSRRQTGSRDDWRARLGFVPRDMRRPVWIHAASAGEMQAALPLVAALARDYPVRLTAFSASGLAAAATHLPDVPASLAPLDLPGAWRRFLARTGPRLLVLVETELWPNLLAAAKHEGMPVVLTSARLTPETAHRLARFPQTIRDSLATLSTVLTQTPEDLDRFHALGLPDGRGRVSGNLKEAQIIPESVRARGRRLRAGPLAGRRVWVAGSVRDGEEALVAEATALIRTECSDAVALIAPRHPERAPAFVAALAARGIESFGPEVLDSKQPISGGAAVVVDRLGELLTLYAASDVAFVGGSFARLGGHNLLEPARLAKPILAGPHLGNVRQQAERLLAAGALFIVEDASTFAEKVITLLNDPAAAEYAGEAGRDSAAESEVLATILAALDDYLEEVDDVARGKDAEAG